jgi:type III pantothenate kinase
MTPLLIEACTASFRYKPVVIDWRSPLPITLEVDEPSTVGADRVINTLAASQLYHRDAVVVDLGTATTFDCITGAGAFIGGVIQPGVQTSVDTLIRKTSMLPSTVLAVPAQTIGKNTAACIQSGIMFGAAESIDGIIRRIKREWPTATTPHVVATGGLAPMFQRVCHEFDAIDGALTLKGIQIAHRIVTGS